MLAGIDTSALQAFSETVSASLLTFELPLIDLSAFTQLQTTLSRLVSGIDVGAIRLALRRGQPPNWDDLGDGVKLSTLLAITDAGLPTAWVPRASVLNELIDADEADRPAVFADRRSEVIEDCRTVLYDLTSPELVDLVELLHEALDVAHDGRLGAAQALAASICAKRFLSTRLGTTPRSRPRLSTDTRTPRSPRCDGPSCTCPR